MKRTKLFLSILVCFLLLFATANAQEITKEKDLARFGIGISYGFKDRVKELIHPIEHDSYTHLRATRLLSVSYDVVC